MRLSNLANRNMPSSWPCVSSSNPFRWLIPKSWVISTHLCSDLISGSSAFSKSSLYIQRSNCQHPLNHRKSKRIPEKTSVSASLTIPKPLIVWITTNWKIFKMMRTPDDFTCLLRNQDKKRQLEPDMEQQTGSKLGKEYVKAIYCPSAYLTYMQSILCEMPGWMKLSWNQDCREKYQQPQICRWHHPNGKKQRGTKEPLDEGERREWRSWLKTQHSEN